MGTTTGLGTLDGSKSYDPDHDPITYQWTGDRQPRGDDPNPTSATPTVEFSGGYGPYEFELAVTDDKGAKAAIQSRSTGSIRSSKSHSRALNLWSQ